MSKVHALENVKLISEKKIEVMEGEIQNLIKENHSLIVSIENETAEKLNFMQIAETTRNKLTLDGAEAHKFQSANKSLL